MRRGLPAGLTKVDVEVIDASSISNGAVLIDNNRLRRDHGAGLLSNAPGPVNRRRNSAIAERSKVLSHRCRCKGQILIDEAAMNTAFFIRIANPLNVARIEP